MGWNGPVVSGLLKDRADKASDQAGGDAPSGQLERDSFVRCLAYEWRSLC